MKIYLDNCCFNRPFDNLSDALVKLESEAVLAILKNCSIGEWTLIGSDVLLDEISLIANADKRQEILYMCYICKQFVTYNETIVTLAKSLEKYGIKPYDALHLASAEYGNADIMLTTDKRLIKAASRTDLNVKVYNPVLWMAEVFYGQ